MNKEGLVVENIRFISKHFRGEDTLFFDVGEDEIVIQTTREPENTQHDIVMTKDEWELLKRLIDNQLVQ